MKKLLYVLLILFFGMQSIWACSCLNDPLLSERKKIKKEFKQRDVIFTAKVLSIENKESSSPGWDGVRYYYFKKIKMELSHVYKGELQEIEIVETLMSSASCGYHFQVGTKYLVYGTQVRVGGPISTNICTRTRPLEYAKKDIARLKWFLFKNPFKKVKKFRRLKEKAIKRTIRKRYWWHLK